MSIIRQFVRHPRMTGAVAASSRRLADAMVGDLALDRARYVVELGPGTGVLTEAILARLPPGARLVAVELNPRLAGTLARRFPDVEVVCGSAADLAGFVTDPVDAVVSGLPWTVMPAAERHRIMAAVGGALTGTGRFATFAYSHVAWTPPARRFAAELAEQFMFVRRGPVVWGNLPPAFVHRAAMPRVRGSGQPPHVVRLGRG